jgi:hypothetical protein
VASKRTGARAIDRRGRSRGVAVSMALTAFLLLPASALAGGGLKPSEAPTITVGQHYFGNATHKANDSKGAGAAAVTMTTLLIVNPLAIDSASATKQACISKLSQTPHVTQAVMYNPGRQKMEVLTKASYSAVEGCDSWQRIGKYQIQVKKPGGWTDLEGDFWYPTDQDVADKNKAHKVAFLDFATHGVYEKCVKGHWEPARVRFINFVKSTATGKQAARGKITDHPIKIEPSGTC